MNLEKIESGKIAFILQAHLFPAILAIPPGEIGRKPEQKGGWFYLGYVHPDLGCITLLHGSHGEMNEGQRWRRYELSREKAMRLAEHPEHMSSRESADPDTQRYPGALRYDKNIIGSFSGFPAHVDEAIVAIIGVQQKLVEETIIWERLGEDERYAYKHIIRKMDFPSQVVKK